MNKKRNVLIMTNQKGGIGKTTTNINAGCALGELGKRVLIFDIDGQANLTTGFGFNPDDFGDSKKSFYDLMMAKKSNPTDYIVKTKCKNVEIVPSSRETYSLDQSLMHEKMREFKLSKIIAKVRNDYDYILIDMAPNLGMTTLNALIASNFVIILYGAAEFSIDAISEMLNTIYDIQEDEDLNQNQIEILGGLWVNKDMRKTKINRQIQKTLGGLKYFDKYFPEIHNAVALEYAQLKYVPINVFDPNHKTTAQFKNLAKEIVKNG